MYHKDRTAELHSMSRMRYSVKMKFFFVVQMIGSTFLLLVAGVIPPIPAEVSQVEFVNEMISETKYDVFLDPEDLGRRLHRLAFSEGDLNRPYAIHQQVQSQAFYRMMIDKYYHIKVLPVWQKHQRAASAGKAFKVSQSMSSLPAQLQQGSRKLVILFNSDRAFKTYDALVAEFWENYRSLFVARYLRRLEEGKEKLHDGNHDFISTFAELPQDKKKALLYDRAAAMKAQYDSHFIDVYEVAIHDNVFQELSSKDSKTLRRLSSFEASSSSSDVQQ